MVIRAHRALTASIARSLLALRRRAFRSCACASNKNKTHPSQSNARNALVCARRSDRVAKCVRAPVFTFRSKASNSNGCSHLYFFRQSCFETEPTTSVFYASRRPTLLKHVLPPCGHGQSFPCPVPARLVPYVVPVQGWVVVARLSLLPCPCRVCVHYEDQCVK